MSKRKRQQAKRNIPVNTGATPKAPMTVEKVKASVSQEEFEKNRDELINQMMAELSEWEKSIDDAKRQSTELNQSVESLEKKKKELTEEKDRILEEYKSNKKEYDDAEAKKSDADKYCEDKRKEGDEYYDNKKKEADAEALKCIKDASDKAREAWQTQIDDLEKQIKDISEREAQINTDRIALEKEKQTVHFDKEMLDEIRKEEERKKQRYEAANPAKISELELSLSDEQSKYNILLEKYNANRDNLKEKEALLDSIQAEIEDSEGGLHITSANNIIVAMKKLSEENRRLASVYEKYPDEKAIKELEEKAGKSEKLESENNALKNERNKYRQEVVAAENTREELEVVKQEAEATKALNEHLLKELESHKTALESRTGDTCPSLTKVDNEVETEDFKNDITKRTRGQELTSLGEIVEHVRNYAGEKKLYYKADDIRAYLAGMAVSRLIILQGISGTGKSSLPRVFAEAISGFDRLIPVESSWRDRNELLGYYNDFNKKFNAKTFTIELYRSCKEQCRQIPTFIVLDEMNLARIEYYFSDFLAILQEPDHNKWLIELVSSDMRTLPMELPDDLKKKMQKETPSIYSIWEKIERSRQGDLKSEISDDDKEILTGYLARLGALTGAKDLKDGRKIQVTDNIWFVGTANQDESTFEISDKVYDRAQVISLNRKGVAENYTPVKEKYISVDNLQGIFEEAIDNNKYKKDVSGRLEIIDHELINKFDQSFGNRIVTQTIDFAGVFTNAGGSLTDALDYQISSKILRKVISSDDSDALRDLRELMKDYPRSVYLIDKRIKELEL